MSWIKTIAYEKADSKLKALYDRVKGPNNNVDNIMMMHFKTSFNGRSHDNIQICFTSP